MFVLERAGSVGEWLAGSVVEELHVSAEPAVRNAVHPGRGLFQSQRQPDQPLEDLSDVLGRGLRVAVSHPVPQEPLGHVGGKGVDRQDTAEAAHVAIAGGDDRCPPPPPWPPGDDGGLLGDVVEHHQPRASRRLQPVPYRDCGHGRVVVDGHPHPGRELGQVGNQHRRLLGSDPPHHVEPVAVGLGQRGGDGRLPDAAHAIDRLGQHRPGATRDRRAQLLQKDVATGEDDRQGWYPPAPDLGTHQRRHLRRVADDVHDAVDHNRDPTVVEEIHRVERLGPERQHGQGVEAQRDQPATSSRIWSSAVRISSFSKVAAAVWAEMRATTTVEERRCPGRSRCQLSPGRSAVWSKNTDRPAVVSAWCSERARSRSGEA